MNTKKQFNASARFSLEYEDLYFEMKALNGRSIRVPVSTVIADIDSSASTGASNAQQSVFMIDYDGDVVLNAAWGLGNYTGKISTETSTVAHAGVSKWHFHHLDLNGENLDAPHGTKSLWDAIIEYSEGCFVIAKIFNRLDKSQYVYLAVEFPIVKANASSGSPIYYDLEIDAYVLKASGIETVSLQNASVAFIIGKQTDVVRNNTDSYSSLPKQKNVVTLTAAEYAAMGPGRDLNTLFIAPCDGFTYAKNLLGLLARQMFYDTNALGVIESIDGDPVTKMTMSAPMEAGVIIKSGNRITVYNHENGDKQWFTVNGDTEDASVDINVEEASLTFPIVAGNYVILTNQDIVYNQNFV